MLLLFLWILSVKGCVWHTPQKVFPEHLVRFQASDMYNRSDNGWSGGLLHDGSMHHAIVFDTTKALSDMMYSIRSISVGAARPSLSSGLEFPVIMHLPHYLSDALAHKDIVTVTVAATNRCLPNRELMHAPYHINITAQYELLHSSDCPERVWSNHGWLGDSSLVLHPQLHYYSERGNGTMIRVNDCLKYEIVPWMRLLNASTFTTWDNYDRTYDVHEKFVTNYHGSPPGRCHRSWMGSVCVVQAGVRMEAIQTCETMPRTFSLTHGVSQFARMSPIQTGSTSWPSTFDESRRAPVHDQEDMRYDLCWSTVSSSGHIEHRENDALAVDGNIEIQQSESINPLVIETTCQFEVVGFLDEIWSPLLYFRHWYDYTF